MTYNRHYMKKFLQVALALIVGFSTSALRAGTEQKQVSSAEQRADTLEPVPLDIFEIQSGFVFQSEVNRDDIGYGDQYEFQNEFQYGHRIHLSGNLYWHLGLAYERFDFGRTAAPVPTHLQSLAGVFGIDYMHGRDVAAFLEVRPGIFTEEHIGISSFDAPITAGRIWVIQPDKLFLFTGVNAAFLRGRFPVLPLVGVIWIPNKQFRLNAILPEPRVIYSPTDKLNFWAGGQFVGGSFRTDHDDTIAPRKLNGAQVDYTDYRAGLGFSYEVNNACAVDLGAGYAIERSFDFHRANKVYDVDPAPYLRLEFKAQF